MSPQPTAATIFAYQVGFGDCFLLRIDYDDNAARHVLIDFGSTALPKNDPTITMIGVAKDIEQRCGGKLEVVVATHRHADHISGFATQADGKGTGDVIRGLKPERVIQPWTEAPNAPTDWTGPAEANRNHAFALRRQSLESMHAVAQKVVDRLDTDGAFPKKWPMTDRLRFIGEDNIKNFSAVKNLMSMAGDQEKHPQNYHYVFHGCHLDLSEILPGVKVHVLGPPTLGQTETVRKMVSKNADEFWLRTPGMMGFGEADGRADAPASILFPKLPKTSLFRGSRLPIEMRWLADRVEDAEADQMLGIVTALDKAMNNTSVILLFEIGGKKLLFPGDAQLENWMYALQSPMADLLDDVALYKVGHHGSLNATPKSLWKRFRKKGDASTEGRLKSVMSTMAGKHGGKNGSPTEVPRRPLVDDLKAESELHNTQDLAPGALCKIVGIPLNVGI